jgi:hypothetical protein
MLVAEAEDALDEAFVLGLMMTVDNFPRMGFEIVLQHNFAPRKTRTRDGSHYRKLVQPRKATIW